MKIFILFLLFMVNVGFIFGTYAMVEKTGSKMVLDWVDCRIRGREKSKSEPVIRASSRINLEEVFKSILELTPYNMLIQSAQEILDTYDQSPEMLRRFFNVLIPIHDSSGSIYYKTFFDIYSYAAKRKEDFVWIMKKLEKCGVGGSFDRDFVWMQLSAPLPIFDLYFFHRMIIMNNFECIRYMFDVLCNYAPNSKILGDFLLRKNTSQDCIFTCICYSSELSENEKINLLNLLIIKIEEIVHANYDFDTRKYIMINLFMNLNKCFLCEAIRITLTAGQYYEWLIPFLSRVIEILRHFGGDRTVEGFVNRHMDVGRQDKGTSACFTPLDIVLRERDLSPDRKKMDFLNKLIDFLIRNGAKRLDELKYSHHLLSQV